MAKRAPAGSPFAARATEGPPRAREKGVLDAGRIGLVSEKLQAFYVRGNLEERWGFFFPGIATYEGVHLLCRLSCNVFHTYIPHPRQFLFQ